MLRAKEKQIVMLMYSKPGNTADGDDDSIEENVVIDALPRCKQYFETSGSEIILTLPVDPHLPNIVYIKTPVAKAIPADATVSDFRIFEFHSFLCSFRVSISDFLGIWSHCWFLCCGPCHSFTQPHSGHQAGVQHSTVDVDSEDQD